MEKEYPLESFAPHFQADEYSERDRWHLAPFFTNLDKSVYAPVALPPELAGALCSRASRAPHDLRYICLKEFIYPYINPERSEKDTEEEWQKKVTYGQELHWFIKFLNEHPMLEIFANPRARTFYIVWGAQYGDDSIFQMGGTHINYRSLSQVAIKHSEDQRIAFAPIEKSTRYVNYSGKINDRYLYYTDPTLKDLGLLEEYERRMDGLFDTYSRLIPKMIEWLTSIFPKEKPSVIEKKAFDTLRGLLPTSTLSQVTFFGNGQSFEHALNRSAKHKLGEIRWAAQRALEELDMVIPSFLHRLKDEEKRELIEEYQKYLAGKGERMAPIVKDDLADDEGNAVTVSPETEVKLIEHDAEGELKVITGMLYPAPNNHRKWNEVLARVRKMGEDERQRVVSEYLRGRAYEPKKQRWQKVGRAFENAYVRFEIVMNIGAWRDLHRHRMLTQQRQNFSCYHGYEVPQEVTDAGLEPEFRSAIDPVEELFAKIATHDLELAQYAVTLAHRIRFMQWENLRQSFWQIELRSIPEGHPDYRHVVQEKFRLLNGVYPLLVNEKTMMVNLGEYDFARRGQEEKIEKKIERLSKLT